MLEIQACEGSPVSFLDVANVSFDVGFMFIGGDDIEFDTSTITAQVVM